MNYELGIVTENKRTWSMYDKSIPLILYNQTTPTHKKARDRTKRYIYTTDKLPIMFTSQTKMRNYVEANREPYSEKRSFPTEPCFWGDGGYFYVRWTTKLRLTDRATVPRVKNINRCIKYWGITRERILYSKVDEFKPLVRYTGMVWSIRKIYKPFRMVNILRIEVTK